MADWDPIRMADVMSSLIGKVGDFASAGTSTAPDAIATSQQINEQRAGGFQQFITGQTGAGGTATPGGTESQPLEGDLRVNSPYGPRNGGFHPGVDLWATQGMTVHAAETGEVSEAVSPAPGNYSVISIRGA